MVNGVDSLLGAATQQSPLSPTSLQPTITSTAPTLSPLGATPPAPPPSAVPQFSENPLGAIGAVLLDASRGARGQPLYTQQLAQQGLRRSQLELQRLSLGMDAATKGVELMQQLPAEQQARFANEYGAQFEQVTPGITSFFKSAAADPEAARQQLEAIGPIKDQLMALSGGSTARFQKNLSNPRMIEQARQMKDAENRDYIMSAFQGVGPFMEGADPGKKKAFDEMLGALSERRFTVAELYDPTFMKALGLTPDHVDTIARDPGLQSRLQGIGLITDEELDERRAQAAEAENLTFKEVESDGQKFIVGLSPSTGQEVSRVPAGKVKGTPQLMVRGDGQGNAMFDPQAGKIFDMKGNELPPETIVFKAGVQAADATGIPGVAPSAKERREAGAASRDDASRLATASNMLEELVALGPGAVGVRGKAVDVIGSTLGQFSEVAADALSKGVANVTPAERAAFIDKARRAIAASIPDVTGQPGRFTQQQFEIATRTNRALETMTSFPQVRSALVSQLTFALLSVDRNSQIAGREPQFDLETDEGIAAMGEQLVSERHLTPAEAADSIRLIQQQRKDMRRVGAGNGDTGN